MKPNISKEIKERVEFAKENFRATFTPSNDSSGKGAIGYLKLNNVLLMAKDDMVRPDGDVIEGTAFVTPRETQNGGFYTGGHVLIPTSKEDELKKLVIDILSGEASGGKPHPNFKASKVKEILSKDNSDDKAFARSFNKRYLENIELVDEENEDREEDDKRVYSPFYQTLHDFSRIILKHHLDKDNPFSSKSFDFRDCLFMIAETGDAPILGRNGLRIKKGPTWMTNEVQKFDESILETPQDYTESDIGSYALADVLAQVYASTYNRNYYIGMTGKIWSVKKLGFTLQSDGGAAIPDAAASMFEEVEEISSKNEVEAVEDSTPFEM